MNFIWITKKVVFNKKKVLIINLKKYRNKTNIFIALFEMYNVSDIYVIHIFIDIQLLILLFLFKINSHFELFKVIHCITKIKKCIQNIFYVLIIAIIILMFLFNIKVSIFFFNEKRRRSQKKDIVLIYSEGFFRRKLFTSSIFFLHFSRLVVRIMK